MTKKDHDHWLGVNVTEQVKQSQLYYFMNLNGTIIQIPCLLVITTYYLKMYFTEFV